MFYFIIDEDKAETLLRQCGYEPHWKGNGWVRDLTDKKRWHAHIKGSEIAFHLDYTAKRNNFHYVVSVKNLNKEEKDRIEAERFKIFGKSKRQIEREKEAERRKLYPNKIAPNVRELQKMSSRLNNPTLWNRLILFLHGN